MAARQAIDLPGRGPRGGMTPMGSRIGNLVYSSAIGARDPDTDNADGVRSALIDKMQDLDRQHDGMGVAVWDRATGATIGTLDHLDDFLSVAIDTPKGSDAKRRDVERLARAMPNLADITRPSVRAWCDNLAKIEHFKRSTIVRLLSSCRMFWGHLQSHGIVSEDLAPFDKLRLPGAKNGGGKAAPKRETEQHTVF